MAVTNSMRPFVPAVYCLGVATAVVAVSDFVGNVWPFRPTAVDWRYGALGILSNFLVTPTFGLLLLAAAASIGRHRIALRVIGVVAISFCALLLVSIALFSLDAVQMRQGESGGAKWLTTVSSAIAVGKFLLAAAVLFALGVGGLRGARLLRTGEGTSQERSGLVVGTS